jgi:potassium-dependent mechanosensitive channel
MKKRTHLLTALCLIPFLHSGPVSGQGILPVKSQEETKQAVADTLPPQPFPVIGITSEFDKTNQLLTESGGKHLSQETVAALRTETDTLFAQIQGFLLDSSSYSLKDLSSRELDQISFRSQFFTDQISVLQNRLSGISDGLESSLMDLQRNREQWRLTRDQREEGMTLESRLERIGTTISQIDSVSSLLQGDLDLILEMQDQLAGSRAKLDRLMSAVSQQKQVLGQNLLNRDSPGFFKDLANLHGSGLINSHIQEFRRSVEADVAILKSNYMKRVIIALVLMFSLLVFTYWFKTHYRRIVAEAYSDQLKPHLVFINSPVAFTLFVSGLLIRLLIPDLPQTFYAVNLLILMIPMAILMIRIYGTVFRAWIIVLVITLIINLLYELIYQPGGLMRIGIFAFTLVGIWLFLWVYKRKPFSGMIRHRFLVGGFRVLVIVFAVMQFLSIIANLVGTVHLAEFLALIPLQITLLAIAIQLATRVADTLLFLILSSNYAQRLNVLREEFQLIYKKGKWLTDFLLLLVFLSFALRILRIRDQVFAWGHGILSDGIKLGAVNITLGSILVFLFVIWLSIIISRIISRIMEKDVFTRVKTGKGIPDTIILLLKIALISGGFFLAAASAGMKLTNLSIVLGAFSVGIGFGLQNIFNNLVSGLILAVERPINVGDVVEVGELVGIVQGIGFRSSRVRSFDGAEVIVPNGNLISNEMINWTLSDSYRRMDIRVGVAYGTDPERVLKLMKEVAANHELVNKNPEPRSYFIEFGDSSLNFRLLAWVNMDHRLEVESELNVLINKRLKEEGIEIPFPQRDLHIRSDDTKS